MCQRHRYSTPETFDLCHSHNKRDSDFDSPGWVKEWILVILSTLSFLLKLHELLVVFGVGANRSDVGVRTKTLYVHNVSALCR